MISLLSEVSYKSENGPCNYYVIISLDCITDALMSVQHVTFVVADEQVNNCFEQDCN